MREKRHPHWVMASILYGFILYPLFPSQVAVSWYSEVGYGLAVLINAKSDILRPCRDIRY